jgi:hypothetical protein
MTVTNGSLIERQLLGTASVKRERVRAQPKTVFRIRSSFSNKPAVTRPGSLAYARGKSCQDVQAKLHLSSFSQADNCRRRDYASRRHSFWPDCHSSGFGGVESCRAGSTLRRRSEFTAQCGRRGSSGQARGRRHHAALPGDPKSTNVGSDWPSSRALLTLKPSHRR